jgi:hypothetical protein
VKALALSQLFDALLIRIAQDIAPSKSSIMQSSHATGYFSKTSAPVVKRRGVWTPIGVVRR